MSTYATRWAYPPNVIINIAPQVRKIFFMILLLVIRVFKFTFKIDTDNDKNALIVHNLFGFESQDNIKRSSDLGSGYYRIESPAIIKSYDAKYGKEYANAK